MAGLPAFILIGFSALIWILRNRHIRTIWILTLTSFFISWLSTFLLSPFLPAETVFSQWETQHLLGSGIKIGIDLSSIVPINSVLLLGLLITLRYDGKEGSRQATKLFSHCLLGGIGLITMLSGNFITFALLWVLWEIILIVARVSDNDPKMTGGDLGKIAIGRLISVPLALAVGIILSTGRIANSAITEETFNWAFIVGCLAVCIRIFLNSYSNSETMESGSTFSNRMWIQGLTIVSGFVFLARIMEIGSAIEQTLLMDIIGVLLIVAGILQMVFLTHARTNLVSIAITFLGVGIVLNKFSAGSQVGMLELVGFFMMLAYVLILTPISIHRWSRVSAIALGTLLIGLPGSISSFVLIAIVETIENGMGYFLSAASLLGVVSVASSILRSRQGELMDQDRLEQSVGRFRDIASPLIIVGSGLVMGLILRPGISIGSVSLFAILVLFSVLVAYALVKIDPTLNLLYFDPLLQAMSNRVASVWLAGRRIVAASVRASGRVFEGRAGLLWVYVIVQFIIVALGVVE